MKVNSASMGQAAPAAAKPAAAPTSKAQEQKAQQSTEAQQPDVISEKFKSHNDKNSMSTEDFLNLHNSSAANMAESIKDVMALKLLEKALEVIDNIVSD